ncbi:MAG: TRAP transporter small permease, partial [Pseudomonadales bacterium]|nr:TRAP transporter small permease [Pseudomonadales bacterium]
LISMLLIAIMQILLRNFFDGGFLWAESFLRILVLWVAMLGALVATRENNHITIDALTRFLAGRKIILLVSNLAASVICGVVAWYAFEFVSYEYQDQTVVFANVPTWLCQSILPIGFTGMSLRFLITSVTGLFD